jgi:hypothetical protein
VLVDSGGREQHPLPPVFPLDPGRGLVRGHHFAAADRRGGGLGGSRQRRSGAGQHVGDRALADADPERFVEQPHQPLQADRLGDMEMEDQRDQIGAKRRAWRHPGRWRRAEAAAAARAHPAMTMDAGDHRAKWRQLDMIIRMKAGLIGRGQRILAVRAAFRHAVDDPVRIGGERPEHPGAAVALFRRDARRGWACALARAALTSCPGSWAARRARPRVRRCAGSIPRSAPPGPGQARSALLMIGSQAHHDTSSG